MTDIAPTQLAPKPYLLNGKTSRLISLSLECISSSRTHRPPIFYSIWNWRYGTATDPFPERFLRTCASPRQSSFPNTFVDEAAFVLQTCNTIPTHVLLLMEYPHLRVHPLNNPPTQQKYQYPAKPPCPSRCQAPISHFLLSKANIFLQELGFDPTSI